MECFTCHEKIKCVNDVNEISVRIDWFECPKCKSKAEVTYGENGKFITKVVLDR